MFSWVTKIFTFKNGLMKFFAISEKSVPPYQLEILNIKKRPPPDPGYGMLVCTAPWNLPHYSESPLHISLPLIIHMTLHFKISLSNLRVLGTQLRNAFKYWCHRRREERYSIRKLYYRWWCPCLGHNTRFHSLEACPHQPHKSLYVGFRYSHMFFLCQRSDSSLFTFHFFMWKPN